MKSLSWVGMALFLVLGCGGQDPAGPETPEISAGAQDATLESFQANQASNESLSRGNFYPLQIGNRWEYTSRIIIQIETDEGPQPPQILHVHRTRTLVGKEMQFGRSYVVEEVTIDEGGALSHQRILYRQDRSGLYEADLPILADSSKNTSALQRISSLTASPKVIRSYGTALSELGRRLKVVHSLRSSATSGRPGGLEDHELLRLQYPLHPGSKWIVRDDDILFSSKVEGHETLDLPVGHVPAWRIRIEASILGPNDDVRFWYGRIGYAGMHTVLTTDLTDEEGNVIGKLLLVEQEDLDAVNFPRSRRHRSAEGESRVENSTP